MSVRLELVMSATCTTMMSLDGLWACPSPRMPGLDDYLFFDEARGRALTFVQSSGHPIECPIMRLRYRMESETKACTQRWNSDKWEPLPCRLEGETLYLSYGGGWYGWKRVAPTEYPAWFEEGVVRAYRMRWLSPHQRYSEGEFMDALQEMSVRALLRFRLALESEGKQASDEYAWVERELTRRGIASAAGLWVYPSTTYPGHDDYMVIDEARNRIVTFGVFRDEPFQRFSLRMHYQVDSATSLRTKLLSSDNWRTYDYRLEGDTMWWVYGEGTHAWKRLPVGAYPAWLKEEMGFVYSHMWFNWNDPDEKLIARYQSMSEDVLRKYRSYCPGEGREWRLVEAELAQRRVG